MKEEQKYDLFCRLWEHHSTLLWNKIQYMLVMMAAFFTAWFLLIGRMFDDETVMDWLYLILISGMCILVVVMCFYFKRLIRRDSEQQRYFEKQMPEIFDEIKSDTASCKMHRGRVIVQKMMNLCVFSCVFLLLLSIIVYFAR